MALSNGTAGRSEGRSYMIDRIKFQVWSPAQERWRTAYCRAELLQQNITLFTVYGFRVR
jgi:hypothetical protein